MATYVALAGDTDNSVLGDLAVVIDGTIVAGSIGGTSVTYGDDPNMPGATITFIGVSSASTESWNVTGITASANGDPVWTITGITGVDGTPTTGPPDRHSIFQAVFFGDAPRLIFHGDNNTIVGGPGIERLFGFGIEGTTQTVVGGSGNEVLSGNGGIDTIYAGTGRDIFLFNFLNAAHPTANVSTIHGFNTAKDLFELDKEVFDHLAGTTFLKGGEFDLGANHQSHLTGTPFLKAGDFHLGANHPMSHAGQIFYNHANGNLWYDFFDTTTHTEVKEHFATVFGAGSHHPTLSAFDFLVV